MDPIPTPQELSAASRDEAQAVPGPGAAALHGEDAFRRVVEWAPSAMVMVDGRGGIVLVNAQAERMFGYRRQELIGRSVHLLVPPQYAAQHTGYLDGFFANPAPRPMGSGRDLLALRADGTEFPVEIGLNPLDTEAGPMVLASVVDITERRRTEQNLARSLREKTVLLNEVHHRVKNNLQVISSLLSLQASSTDDPRLREMLTESQNRVRAMALTHQLLYERKDFSRIDLGEYLERLSQLLLSAYRGRTGRIGLRLDLPGDRHYVGLELAIPCGLVVNELVTNAFKHAFPGGRGGEIVVSLAAAGDDLELAVADDGAGLPPGFAMEAVKSLGLQLVPLLVEQLHGRLEVAAGNPGSRFVLHFSAAPEAARSPP